MTKEYVEEDNLKFLLTDDSNWLVTTAILKFLMNTFRVTSLLR